MFSWLPEFLARWVRIPAPWPTALAVAFAVLLAGVVLYRILWRALGRLTSTTETTLDEVLLRRMRFPAQVLVALLAVHTLLALRDTGLGPLRGGVVVVELLLVAYLAIETAETLFFHYWLGERKQIPVPALVRHIVLVVLYTAVVLSVLGTVTGFNLVPLLATSTVVTVVVGMALQETLGNLFSGLALHAERPFRLGQWIVVDGVEGQVVYMGWRSTQLRTFTQDLVVFPNAVVARSRVHNFSAPERVTGRTVEVLVPLDAAPDRVERAVAAALETVPLALSSPPSRAWLVGATALYQRYAIRFFVEGFERHDDAESDVLKALWRAFDADGLGLPAGMAAEDLEGGVSVTPRRRD